MKISLLLLFILFFVPTLSIIGNNLLEYKWNEGNILSVVGHLVLERVLGSLILLVVLWALGIL